MTRTLVPLFLAVLGSSCGGPQDPATEDLTAQEHEAEAQQEEREAAEQERLATYGLTVYDPSDARLSMAVAHREHADAHRRRADALRAFEDAECGEFPPSARAACPFLLGLERVEDVEGGAKMTFSEGAPVEAIVDHIRCHLAFVAAQGSEGIDDCALYVPGAVVDEHANMVVLTTDQPDQVVELRRRVRVQEDH